MNKNRINICQPGYNASCALCCGSHNFTSDLQTIIQIYKSRCLNRDPNLKNTTNEISKRLKKGIQCPHIAFTNHKSETIRCSIYDIPKESNPNLNEFFTKTCKTFSCKARDILIDGEIIFAAKLTQDWFYYSILINDINTLKNLYTEYKISENVPDEKLITIKEKLKDQLNLI